MTMKTIDLDQKFGMDIPACNEIYLLGIVEDEFTVCHTFNGENFFRMHVRISRLSGVSDYVPIIVGEHSFPNVDEYKKGNVVEVRGNIRTFYKLKKDKKLKMDLYVQPYYLEKVYGKDSLDVDEFFNYVRLYGYICREPYTKVRGDDRIITELLIRVKKKKSNEKYVSIPCVSWYDNADYLSKCNVGDKLCLLGRLQSRKYIKYNKKTDTNEEMTTYEVAISEII